ncbi:hypothetical protein ACR9YC_07165 [Parasphingorhabdus sp. DH2-15]|uniref:hypothetical protein n=1 Tax=Parasphingorhabdus sp. DH2-15 TaxID=3444112 RepID=UPI003F683FA4
MTPIFGHIDQQKWLISSMRERRLHHGIILAGRKGLGKFLFAQHAAAAILSQDDNTQIAQNADAKTLSDLAVPRVKKLITNDHHPDLHVIKRGPKNDTERKKAEKGNAFERGRNIKVDQIRLLQRRFSTRPTLGSNRVIIIDAADDMERGAANALLKSLEEPSENIHFLLISHNPGKLLPTIRSRCQLLRFEPLSIEHMVEFLNSSAAKVSDDARDAILQHNNGIPGDIIAMQDSKQAEMLVIANRIIEEGDSSHSQRTALAVAATKLGGLEPVIAFMQTLPPLLAEHAKSSHGPARQAALDSWSSLRKLIDTAKFYNYDNQALIFHIAGLLAEPARIRTEHN